MMKQYETVTKNGRLGDGDSPYQLVQDFLSKVSTTPHDPTFVVFAADAADFLQQGP